MPRARVTSKGQITIPKEVREHLGVGAGDLVDFHVDGGRVEMRPIRRRKLIEFRGTFRVPVTASFEDEREQAWKAETARLGTDSLVNESSGRRRRQCAPPLPHR